MDVVTNSVRHRNELRNSVPLNFARPPWVTPTISEGKVTQKSMCRTYLLNITVWSKSILVVRVTRGGRVIVSATPTPHTRTSHDHHGSPRPYQRAKSPKNQCRTYLLNITVWSKSILVVRSLFAHHYEVRYDVVPSSLVQAFGSF